MTDHLINEVDEALRREKLETFWRNFGKYVVAFSIIIILVTVAVVSLKNHQNNQKHAISAQLVQARKYIEDQQYDKAAVILHEVSISGDQALEATARLWLALLLLRQEKSDEAAVIIAEIKQNDVSPAYTDFATLLEHNATGTTLSENSGIFRLTLQEMKAIRLWQQGELQAAHTELVSLRDGAETPQSMRERTTMLLEKLALELPASAKTSISSPEEDSTP